MMKKHTGAYYTPQLLADYIVYRLFDEGNYKFDSAITVLEPSVGDGIFLNALLNGNYYKDVKHIFKKDIPYVNIDAIEIDPDVADETRRLSRDYEASKGTVRVINHNYLEHYLLNNNQKYDLIIGNPPYVRRRNMNLEQRELCAQVHKKSGFKDLNPKNLWTSFLAGAKESLADKGVIAFILPADLLQVKYSEEIREMILNDFERVEMFTLNWIYFDDIEQDVVILICSNGHGKARPRFIHIDSLEDLEKPKLYDDYDNSQRATINKWTNYVLSEEEFTFLDSIFEKINPKSVRHYCDSGAGIVTAANDYYIVDRNTVNQFSLQHIAKYTIKKSSSMFPAVILKKDDLHNKAEKGAELFFLDFPDKPKRTLPESYKKYLELGERQNLHERYKMLLRDNWYAVPSIWLSEAFFTKRTNIYPRIILNEAGAYVTDAFYRIRVKDGVNVNNLTFSFYNTFTFIYAELMGRYYGGGVLELTPNEFKDVPLPYIQKSISTQLTRLDKLIRKNIKLGEILDYTDEIILRDNFGLTLSDVDRLRKIYTKLLIRRMKKTDIGI